jgi:asparagine synthase (glutamine-hydrolysing)
MESAIDPGFAARIGLHSHELAGLVIPARPLEQRLLVLQQGLIPVGATLKQVGTAHAVDIRDPTADVRLLKFVLAVPDHIFTGPTDGIDRWLIREAMVDRLPAEVRLNRRRGRQAGDLVPRLRATASEVDAALEEIDGSLASCYLDIGKMRGSWRLIQSQDTAEAYSLAVTTLTRGLMAGLFLANLDPIGPRPDPWSGA